MLHKAGENPHSITSGGDKKLVETHILTHLGGEEVGENSHSNISGEILRLQKFTGNPKVTQ